MHEYSLAGSILTFCEKESGKHPDKKIREVTLLIGVMGGVETDLLEEALNHLKMPGPFADTRFSLEKDPVLLKCRNCRKENSLYKIALQCPSCSSEDVEFIGGRELLIKSITYGTGK